MKPVWDKRIRQAAAPSLGADEQVEVTASALVGQYSVAKTAAIAAVATVASLGTLTVIRRPRKLFVALTDQRMLFFEGSMWTGHPTSKVVMEIPRAAIVATGSESARVGAMPTLVVKFEVAGWDKGMTLQFPTVAREEGRQFAESLERATTTD